MDFPPFLVCKSEADYLAEYERTYCRRSVTTFDGIRVFFRRDKFRHAFYESTRRDGVKDSFSQERAQCMGWIEATLIHPDATLYMGWDKAKKRYDASNRVCIVYGNFVVVIRLYRKNPGTSRGIL